MTASCFAWSPTQEERSEKGAGTVRKGLASAEYCEMLLLAQVVRGTFHSPTSH